MEIVEVALDWFLYLWPLGLCGFLFWILLRKDQEVAPPDIEGAITRIKLRARIAVKGD